MEIERNRWMDGMKFILIVLVVFGHCKQFTSYDNSYTSTRLVSYAIHSIYLFHMPLFIMISGYFSKRTERKHFIQTLKRLFQVFIIFHFLWIIIEKSKDALWRILGLVKALRNSRFIFCNSFSGVFLIQFAIF